MARLTSLLLAGVLVQANAAQAQARWTVAPRLSLAWWQVVPHMGHLWATTCPQDLSWQPGEGRTPGWALGKGPPPTNMNNVIDTIHVPLYPRLEAKPICARALAGEFFMADRARWQGIRGQVTVRVGALVTGQRQRDEYARDEVLQARRFPEIRFTVDSVVVEAVNGDTLTGQALGTLVLHGVMQSVAADVRAWPDAGGVRVLATFRIPSSELSPVYRLSRLALGLGVGLKIWQWVYAGVDVVLLPDEGQP